MLTTAHLITLALVQGVTEFLPISSSGHLVLMPHFGGWPDHGLAYDVAAHLGSLTAVVLYFRHDISRLTGAWFASLRTGGNELMVSADARLAWGVLFATIPVSVIGLLAHDFIAENMRDPVIIAATTIGFGLVLGIADVFGRREREVDSIGITDIVVIGFAQALALIPGTSRSGITMSAGLALGLTREAAARYSFLLSIPVIALAAGYESWNLFASATQVNWGELFIVAAGSAASALLCIAVFLRFLERVGFGVFVIYRIALGIVLIALFL